MPFQILGVGDDGKAYFVGHDGRLYDEKLKSINRQFLRVLAPPQNYWVNYYPTKRGIDWDVAEADIVTFSQQKNFFIGLLFETPARRVRCMGWTVLAPFCGALEFRPTLLMTGESGWGKT